MSIEKNIWCDVHGRIGLKSTSSNVYELCKYLDEMHEEVGAKPEEIKALVVTATEPIKNSNISKYGPAENNNQRGNSLEYRSNNNNRRYNKDYGRNHEDRGRSKERYTDDRGHRSSSFDRNRSLDRNKYSNSGDDSRHQNNYNHRERSCEREKSYDRNYSRGDRSKSRDRNNYSRGHDHRDKSEDRYREKKAYIKGDTPTRGDRSPSRIGSNGELQANLVTSPIIKFYDYLFGFLLGSLKLASDLARNYLCLLDIAFIRRKEFCLICQGLLKALSDDYLSAWIAHNQVSYAGRSQQIVCFPMMAIVGSEVSSTDSGSSDDEAAPVQREPCLTAEAERVRNKLDVAIDAGVGSEDLSAVETTNPNLLHSDSQLGVNDTSNDVSDDVVDEEEQIALLASYRSMKLTNSPCDLATVSSTSSVTSGTISSISKDDSNIPKYMSLNLSDHQIEEEDKRQQFFDEHRMRCTRYSS